MEKLPKAVAPRGTVVSRRSVEPFCPALGISRFESAVRNGSIKPRGPCDLTQLAGAGNVRHHLALAALNQGAHVVLPHCQRIAHLALVGAAVVDARRSALVPALMVENLLDDVRLHADIGHTSRNGPSDVVDLPTCHAGPRIEGAFALDPTGETVAAHPEQRVA